MACFALTALAACAPFRRGGGHDGVPPDPDAPALAKVLAEAQHGDLDAADQAAAAALGAAAAPGTQTQPETRAVLWLCRAWARERRGDLDAARRFASAALSLDSQLTAARLLRIRLDLRLARHREMAADLQLLAASPGSPERAAAARSALRATTAWSSGDSASALVSEARALLAAGDAAAAEPWVRRSLDRGPNAEALGVLAAAQRARGDRRRAYETGLLELETFGSRSDLILALHDDCVALGDQAFAQRWLARIRTGLAADESWRQRRDRIRRTPSGSSAEPPAGVDPDAVAAPATPPGR